MGDDMIIKELERLKDESRALDLKVQNIELTVTALSERDAHREEAVNNLRAEFKETLAKLEGMITSLTTQVSTLVVAGPKRAERRLEDISKVIRDWVIVGILSFAAYKLLGNIGIP